QSAYDEAEKRLSSGKGNVIRQAQMLKDLGVKATKALPNALVDASGANDLAGVDTPEPAPPQSLALFDEPQQDAAAGLA
ncbi:MAG: hypothetical protein JF585_03150, partial [Burkholderiales bacterium]|nr:hypothetical protein [Burkholderiales bacterium]